MAKGHVFEQKVRVANQVDKHISYRLNLLGLTVWHDRCQLVAKGRSGDWAPFGPMKSLPIILPENPDESEGDPLVLTAYQYDLERPGSDLRSVLSKSIKFEEALNDSQDGRIQGSNDLR